MQTYFFIDSKGKNSGEQYAFVFENNLYAPENVTVVVKFHFRSIFSNIRMWRKYRFKIKVIWNFRDNILSNCGGIIFYFFNSPENVRLVRNRTYIHIFFGHGESNKKASLHPLYRIYDFLLASGPFAADRFVEYGVLNASVAKQNVRDILGSGVTSIKFDDVLHIGNVRYEAEEPTVIYMPTWEGANEQENYCTLATHRLASLLMGIAKKNGAKSIFLKPHANTGSRDKVYREAFGRLISELTINGLAVLIDRRSLRLVPFFTRLKIKARQLPTLFNPKISLAVVDVSAAESMAAKRGLPTIVLSQKNRETYAPESYISLKGASVLVLDDWQNIDACVEHIFSQLHSDAQTKYINYFRDDRGATFKALMDALTPVHHPSDRHSAGS